MPFGEPHGSTYLGDGGGWETPAQEAAREREDAITDAALEALAATTAKHFSLCVGCERLVHHTEVTAHARTCAPLRAWAGEQV